MAFRISVFVVILCVIIVHVAECGRQREGGRRKTTPQYDSRNRHHTTHRTPTKPRGGTDRRINGSSNPSKKGVDDFLASERNNHPVSTTPNVRGTNKTVNNSNGTGKSYNHSKVDHTHSPRVNKTVTHNNHIGNTHNHTKAQTPTGANRTAIDSKVDRTHSPGVNKTVTHTNHTGNSHNHTKAKIPSLGTNRTVIDSNGTGKSHNHSIVGSVHSPGVNKTAIHNNGTGNAHNHTKTQTSLLGANKTVIDSNGTGKAYNHSTVGRTHSPGFNITAIHTNGTGNAYNHTKAQIPLLGANKTIINSNSTGKGYNHTAVHTTPLGVDHGHNSPPYNPHHNGPSPAPPYPQYPQGGYHPQAGGVTVINNVNNHHGHVGWSYSAPVYTTHETGNTTLGFFLGHSLAKVTTPSYHIHNTYSDGFAPTYDHYTVHHYYHNKETVPKETTIQPNAIVACVGDSGSFCPSNTTSLCTNIGEVMCVASATSTVPCTNEKQTNCVRSTVPCKDNNSPECKQSSQDTASISIPCISTVNVFGNVSYVNNSIVIGNITADSDRRVFCVTVLALPAERKLSQGEKLFSQGKNILSTFVVKALGIK